LNWRKNFLCQQLNTDGINDARQTNAYSEAISTWIWFLKV
jgi:hypothetical protein